MKFLLLCFSSAFILSISAQDFNKYEPALCQGAVPEEFLKLSSQKAAEAVKAVKGKDLERGDRKAEQDYAISSNFLLDELLSSGQILFGDSMSVFINRIADILLAHDPGLRKQLRFYVYRSTIPNAYATPTGVVLVSIGLLARVENEAQIASILGHEIQHYVKKHSLKQFKKAKEIQRSLSRVSIEERLNEFYRFSKESEMEADDLGFELMLKTPYNLHQGIEVFEMLKYTEYPFLETALSADSFETENFRFPEEVDSDIEKLLSRKTVSSDDDEDEEGSTHPSLSKRINRLKDMLDEEGIADNGNNFLISEKSFYNIQRQARCELLLLYLRSASYGKVIYLSRIMDLLYGKTEFVDKVRAMGWYGLATHRMNNESLDEYGSNTKYSVGSWRPFFAMLSALKSQELASLSMRELYLIKKSHPETPWFSTICDEVFRKVQVKENIRLEDYLAFKPEEKTADTASVAPPPSGGSLVMNPKVRSTKKTENSRKNYFYSVFYDLNENKELRKYFASVKVVEEVNTDKSRIKSKKKRKKDRVATVNSLVMFEPTYNQYISTASGKSRRTFFSDEAVTAKISNLILRSGESSGMTVNITSGGNKENLTLEDINRYMVLNDWFLERMSNDTLTMSLFNAQYVKPYMDGYNSNYLGWSGFKYVSESRSFNPAACLYSAMFVIPFPIYLAWQLSKNHYVNYVMVVYNTETGQMHLVQRRTYKHRLSDDFMRAQIYKCMYNIQYSAPK